MLKQIFKWFDITVAVILTVLLGAFMGLYAWVSWQPREVTQYVPALLDELDIDLSDSGYDVQMDKVIVRNGGFSSPIMLSIEGFNLKNLRGERLADIPEFRIVPSFTALLQGKLFPRSIDIIGADFDILQDDKGKFYLDTKEQIAPVELNSLFFSAETDLDEVGDKKGEEGSVFEELFTLGLERINISDATVGYKSKLTGFALNLSNVSAQLDASIISQNITGNVSATHVNSFGKPAVLQAVFDYENDGKLLKADINAHKITLAEYADASSGLEDLRKINMPLSGKISSQIALPNEIKSMAFNLRSAEMANLRIKGNVSGTFAKPTVVASGTLGQFDLAFLKKNWPKGAGKDAIRWIKNSIKQAVVDKAEFKLNINPETLKLPVLPKGAVKAVLHIKDAAIEFVSGFPEVRKAKGRVIFEGQSLLAEIDSVKVLHSTKLHKTNKSSMATVRIPNLMLDNINILVNVPLQTSMRDVLKFMQATPYKLPSSLPLQADKMKGNMQANLSMDIVDNISPIEDDVDFKLDGKLSNIAYNGFAAGVDLSGLNGNLKASNDTVDLSASGKFNQHNFRTNVAIGGEGAEKYSYNGYLPVPVIALFKPDIRKYVSGSVSLDAKWQKSGAKADGKISLKADTTGINYNFSDFGIRKYTGANGLINAKGSVNNARVSLSSLLVKDTAVNFNGSLSVSRNTGRVLNSKINKLYVAGSDVSGSYHLKSGKHYIKLKGNKLNIESLLGKKKAKSKHDKTVLQRLTDTPSALVDISFNKVRFGADRELQNARFTADCNSARCDALDLSFSNGKTPFSAKISKKNGHRSFTAKTPDLGRILRVTGMFEDMRNGALNINAIYKDELLNRPMVGRFVLEDFNVRNIPVLAKLLTVATFTGILDSLSGGGLSFHKMVAPFQYDRQKIILKGAKAGGPSIGITGDGELNIKPNILKLDGVIIPAKLLDTVIGNIPLIGDVYKAITGDEGLFAMNYSMSGNADNPRITVNPLSALTPGFLRGFFDIFDTSTKKEIKDADAAEKAIKSVEKELDAMEDEASEAAEKENAEKKLQK